MDGTWESKLCHHRGRQGAPNRLGGTPVHLGNNKARGGHCTVNTPISRQTYISLAVMPGIKWKQLQFGPGSCDGCGPQPARYVLWFKSIGREFYLCADCLVEIARELERLDGR